MTTRTVQIDLLGIGDGIDCEVEFSYFPAECQSHDNPGCQEEYEITSIHCGDSNLTSWIEVDSVYYSIIKQLKQIRHEEAQEDYGFCE